MANNSDVKVKVQVADSEYDPVEVDFDSPHFAPLVKAIAELSYGGEGTHEGGGVFMVSGRWNYSRNFDWRDDVRALAKVFVDTVAEMKIDEPCLLFDYVDADTAMDWIGYGRIIVYSDGSVNQVEDVSMSLNEGADDVEYPGFKYDGEDVDSDDYIEKYYAWYDGLYQKYYNTYIG